MRSGEAIVAALTDRGLRRLAAVRRSRRRPGAAADADRRRLPGPARPLRRGRLHPGAARADRHPLHRLGRAGVGAGDEQGARPRRSSGCTTCRRRPATSCRPTRRGPARAARRVRLPGRRQAGGRRLVAGRCASRATSSSSRPPSRMRCASTTTCSSNASSKARRSRWAILDGKPLGAVEIAPKRGFYDFHNKYTRGRTDYHFPARLSPERYRSVLAAGDAGARGARLRGRDARRPHRQRARQRGHPGGQHAPRDDADQPAAQDRARRRPVVRGPGRGDAARRAPARPRPPSRSPRRSGRLRRDPSAGSASSPTRISRSRAKRGCAGLSRPGDRSRNRCHTRVTSA